MQEDNKMEIRVAMAIRKQFRIALGEALPMFRPAMGEPAEPLCDLYRWKASQWLTFYVYLRFDSDHDGYTIECACSPQHQWPRKMTGTLRLCGGDYRFPFAHLLPPDQQEPAYYLGCANTKDPSSQNEADLLAELPGQVNHCIQK